MYNADYAVARCLSVCQSHARILSKRLNISSNLFSQSVSHTILVFFHTKRYDNIPTGTPNGGIKWGVWKIAIVDQCLAISPKQDTANGKPYQAFEWYHFNDFEWPLAQISRSRYYSTPNNSIIIQNTATLTMTDQMNVVKRRHFQWPWTTPNPYFKVAAFVDAEHLSNSK